MTKTTRNVLLLLAVVYCTPVLLVVGIVAYLALRPVPPAVPLPHPNAYDVLVKAGGMISTNVDGYARMSAYQLRPAVEQNVQVVSQARDALDDPCGAPVDESTIDWRMRATNYSRLRTLAHAFAAEGKLAQLDHNSSRAAECDLDLSKLGADAGHGGILSDVMMSSALESLGTVDLPKWVSQLDAPTCRAAAATLEIIDRQKPPWSGVVQQEENWMRRTFGMRSALIEWSFHLRMKTNLAKWQRNYEAEQLRLRHLMIDLASRAYELDQGHAPASAAALVPEYLKAVPKNPANGRNLN